MVSKAGWRRTKFCDFSQAGADLSRSSDQNPIGNQAYAWLNPTVMPLDTPSRRAYHSVQEVMNSDFPTRITMSTLVRVQRKGQVTIPTRLRAQVGLVDGDLVEARAHRGKIVLTPKSVVDREYTPTQRRAIDARLAEGLADIDAGRTFGPFSNADEMIAHMEARTAKKATARKPKRSR
jgi:AbrB family looped-hinge helix DNA binding protein